VACGNHLLKNLPKSSSISVSGPCICIQILIVELVAFIVAFPVALRFYDYLTRFFDFHWRLGIDGLSIGLVLLTSFITTLATLAARWVNKMG
jgi:NADH:ubiquinone oxidoreductase subunit 4 (subunit M)